MKNQMGTTVFHELWRIVERKCNTMRSWTIL